MTEGFEQPAFIDALFRQKRKHGKFRFVEPPRLAAPVADTHAHVHLLDDPPLTFARAAAWGVDFICNIVDIYGGEPATFDLLDGWLQEAAARTPELLAQTNAVVAAGADEGGVSHFPEKADARAFAPVACGVADGCGDGALASGDSAAGASAAVMPRVRLAVGCHPHNASHYDDALEEVLLGRLADPRVCAIGEIGLDYHYDFSPRDAQREAFRRQIRLAHETGLPVALHVREAHDEAFQILEEEGFPQAGVLLHCFDLDWATLEPWISRGCYVALGGALTFKRCEDTREAVARVSRDLLLTETDSPYMAPEPLRGMACEPMHTIFTAACMADVLGCETPDQVAELLNQLEQNARRLLNRQPTVWQLEHAWMRPGFDANTFAN